MMHSSAKSVEVEIRPFDPARGMAPLLASCWPRTAICERTGFRVHKRWVLWRKPIADDAARVN